MSQDYGTYVYAAPPINEDDSELGKVVIRDLEYHTPVTEDQMRAVLREEIAALDPTESIRTIKSLLNQIDELAHENADLRMKLLQRKTPIRDMIHNLLVFLVRTK